VNDWLPHLGSWIEHHSGDAAWVQAIGATLAVIAAVLVPARQGRHARQQRDADRRLRAKSLAIAIYPDLLHIRAMHRRVRRRLQEPIECGAGDQGGSDGRIPGTGLADEARRLLIPISESLRAMVPDFYLLGEPIGPEVQRCIGRCMKYNDVMTTLFGSGLSIALPDLLTFIESSLAQTETCIARIEDAWGVTSDTRALADPIFDQFDPPATPERETRAKEIV